MKLKRLVVGALCAALYTVLANYVSIHTLNMKLTFDMLPVLLCSILYGPVDGLMVGLVGNFISQLIGPYGLSITTPLWMLPAGVRGLLVGFWAKGKGFRIEKVGLLFPVILLTGILSTIINTGVMWVDAKVFGYPFAATIPTILLRLIACLVTSVLFTAVLPPLTTALKKAKVV
ncbi:MAG: folate family ECF transporter S component [Lachnospiraceae bacterium]|nr:folate family ECF transporter S component [Lachnospiraceae bacterium]